MQLFFINPLEVNKKVQWNLLRALNDEKQVSHQVVTAWGCEVKVIQIDPSHNPIFE